MGLEDKFDTIDEVKILKDRLEETIVNSNLYGSMNSSSITKFKIEETHETNPERFFKMVINNEGSNDPIYMSLEIKNLFMDKLKEGLMNLSGILPGLLTEKLNDLNDGAN